MKKLAVLILSLVIGHSSVVHAGWVAETADELSTQGDWNGDGQPDLLLLDRATGVLRIALWTNGGALSWQEPVPTGVEAATSIAFGQFFVQGQTRPGLAITSPSLNRVQVIAPQIAEPQALYAPGLGPNTLVTLAGGPAAVGGGLLIGSTLNEDASPWSLAQLGALDLAATQALLERGNEIAGGYQGFMARATEADGSDSFRLHQGGLVAWKTLAGVPAASDWAIGQFTATASRREYLFWQRGQSTLRMHSFDTIPGPPSFSAATDFTLPQSIAQVTVLTGTTPPRLLIIFDGGTSAGVYDFDGVNAPALAHTLTPEPGQTFRSALAWSGGDFHLFAGAAGSLSSTSAQRYRRQLDGSYVADAASTIPSIGNSSRRANLLLYSGEPFVDPNARLVSALSTRDWTTAAIGVPGMIQATAEIFQSSTAGLGQPANVSLGASSYAPSHSLPNQYADDVSISVFSAPTGFTGTELRLSPPPGHYANDLNVTIDAIGLTPGAQVRYRTGSSEPWQIYDTTTKPPIAITGTTLLQAYAVSGGSAVSPVVGGLYSFGSGSSPAFPITLAATSVTATSAVLHATVDPNGSATTASFSYGSATTASFSYGISTSLGLSTNEQSLGSGDSAVPVSTPVNGLQPHRTYYFRVKATSTEGTNVGQKLSFTTGNRAPVFADATINGSEDTPLTATLVATDPDNDALTFTKLSDPAHGTVTVSSSGAITYTPQADYNGTDSFTAKATDAYGGEDNATITLVIAPVNDLPVALSQTVQCNMFTRLNIRLTATDLENDPLTWEITTQPAHGTITGTAPNLEYNPAFNFSGTDSLSFRVKDGANVFSSPATVTINVSLSSPYGNVRTWIGGTTGLWSDKNSWDPNLVPTNQDRAIIKNQDIATLDIDTEVGQLDLNGTVKGNAADGTRTLTARSVEDIGGMVLQNGVFNFDTVTGYFLNMDHATLNLSGHMFGVREMNLSNGSTLNNAGVISVGDSFFIDDGTAGNSINNSGTFICDTENVFPYRDGNINMDVEFKNAGIVQLDRGSLRLTGRGSFTQTAGLLLFENYNPQQNGSHRQVLLTDKPLVIQGGKLAGDGTIYAPQVIVGEATVAPGGFGYYTIIGTLTIGGEMTLTADSKVAVDLGGSIGHDGIEISGINPLALNGSRLEVRFTNGFERTVQASDTFTITSGVGSTTGQFSNVVNGRVDTTDYMGSFAVSPAGPGNVVLSNFQPYPFISVGTATDGELSDGTSTVNFGLSNVAPNGTTQTFTVRNYGRAPLTGLGLSFSGANASDFTVTTPLGATTLAPSATTTFVVTFKPGATGPRTAQLQLTSNDPNNSPFDVTLNGAGNTPPVLNLPASPLIVDAPNPTGSYVTFALTATDLEDNPDPIPTATPASGSFFYVGDTVVNVSVTDSTGATTTGSFIVHVGYAPPIVTTLPAIQVGNAKATLRGSVTFHGALASVWFEYGTTTSYGDSTASQDVATGFEPQGVFAPIAGLTQNTPYHCRLVASTSVGTFTGNDITFVTLPNAPAPVVTDDAFTTNFNETLYLQGSQLTANDFAGPSGLPFEIVAVGDAVHCSVYQYGGNVYVYPDSDFTGTASFTYTVDNGQGGIATASVTVDVTPPPIQPSLSGSAAIVIPANGVTPWLSFVVGPTANASAITVTASSDNLTLLPLSRIDFQGTGASRQMRLRPLCGQTGQAVITLTATSVDDLTATTSFSLSVADGPGAKVASIIALGSIKPPNAGRFSFASTYAHDISADGIVVTGLNSSFFQSLAFRWTEAGGISSMGNLVGHSNVTPSAISADGSVIAGNGYSPMGEVESFLWSNGVFQVLPDASRINDLSTDGTLAVGCQFFLSSGTPSQPYAGYWTETQGWFSLPLGPEYQESQAFGISSDQSTIVGSGTTENGVTRAIVWQKPEGFSGYITPMVPLPSLDDGEHARALAVSADGSVIVGYSDTLNEPGTTYPVRWVRNSTGGYDVEALGLNVPYTEARSVSADGSRIVISGNGSGAYIWDASNGVQSLQDVLINAGVDFYSGWASLSEATAISADGRYVIGVGYRSNFTTEAFRIELPHAPAPPSISAIADQSTPISTPTPAIPFILTDADSNLECLTISVVSSNQALVPDASIVIGGTGSNRTVTITPATGQSGMVLIVISVSDGFGIYDEAFTLTITSPVLSWRQLYFGTTADFGDAADLADPEHDGRPNLEEFAFGTHPLSGALGPVLFSAGTIIAHGSPVPVPAGVLGNPQPLAVFCRRVDYQAAGLTYTVLFSADIIHKVPVSTVPTVLATDGEIEVVAVPYPATIEVAGQNVVPQFFQVRIARAP